MNRVVATALDGLLLRLVSVLRDRRPFPPALPPDGEPTGLEGVAEAARAAAVPLERAVAGPELSGIGALAEDYVLRRAEDANDRVRHAWPARTVRRRVAFPSPLPGPHKVNNTVGGVYYAPQDRGAPAGAVVILHGYRQGASGPTEMLARWCAEAGWGGMAITLPYHMARRVPGTRAGELMLSADIGQSLRALRQAVADSIAAVEMLRRAGARRVGLVGGSLGGLVAALVAACYADLDALVLVVPVTETLGLAEHHPLFRRHRRAFRAAGIDRADLERALRGVTPGELTPVVPRERMLFLYGAYDLVVRPEAVERLWRAWGEPARKVYPYGHFSLVMFARDLFPDIGRFLWDRGWPPPSA